NEVSFEVADEPGLRIICGLLRQRPPGMKIAIQPTRQVFGCSLFFESLGSFRGRVLIAGKCNLCGVTWQRRKNTHRRARWSRVAKLKKRTTESNRRPCSSVLLRVRRSVP